MKGYLIDKNGALTLLPEFLSWDVCHGMGEPCDWFEVSFIYYSAQLPKLQSACRFRAVHNNGVVFKGIIDEYSISIDEKGSVVTLSGRSDAALLLDNDLRYFFVTFGSWSETKTIRTDHTAGMQDAMIAYPTVMINGCIGI